MNAPTPLEVRQQLLISAIDYQVTASNILPTAAWARIRALIAEFKAEQTTAAGHVSSRPGGGA